MAAVYDVQVKNQLYDYEKSLRKYPIRANRRKIKVSSLRTFLQQLSKNALSHPICDKKKLGQVFSSTDEPLDKNLRQTNYQDESGTQWSISFFQISKNTVKIYRLYQTSYVSETIGRSKTIIRLNEFDLHRMIKESVRQVLEENDSLVNDKVGDYDVVYGNLFRQKLRDCPEMGGVEDVCLYSNVKNGGKTYALYRIYNSQKYFFTEWIPFQNSKKTLAKKIKVKEVPKTILNHAYSLIHWD